MAATSQTASGNEVAKAQSKSPLPTENVPEIDCRDLGDLDITVVEQPTRVVRVLYKGTLIKDINVPLQVESGVSGFSLNWAKKTKEGFEISIEYGSRVYFDKRLMFSCRTDGFHLTKIKVESFDKRNPDKWTNKIVPLRPPVRLQKFNILDYTGNP